MRNFVDIKSFKKAAKENKADGLCLRKSFIPEEKAIDLNKRTISFVISTAAIDRDGDSIAIEGWNIENYLKNPVVLFGHDYYSPPVGKALMLSKSGGKLRSVAQFPEKDMYPFADMIFRMFSEGYLNATSVGFAPTKWSYVDEGDRKFGVDFEEQELLEYSVVPVPANPEALIEARSKGIQTGLLKEWAEKILGTKDLPLLPVTRSDLESVIRIVGKDKTVVQVSGINPQSEEKDGDTVAAGAAGGDDSLPAAGSEKGAEDTPTSAMPDDTICGSEGMGDDTPCGPDDTMPGDEGDKSADIKALTESVAALTKQVSSLTEIVAGLAKTNSGESPDKGEESAEAKAKAAEVSNASPVIRLTDKVEEKIAFIVSAGDEPINQETIKALVEKAVVETMLTPFTGQIY